MSGGSLIFSARLPGLPPSVNHSYSPKAAKSLGGRRMRLLYKRSDAKKWQREAAEAISASYPGGTPAEGKVELRIVCWTKNNRRMDIDNRVKAVQDSLAAAFAIKDDSQIWKLEVSRRLLTAGGEDEYTEVSLFDLGEAAAGG